MHLSFNQVIIQHSQVFGYFVPAGDLVDGLVFRDFLQNQLSHVDSGWVEVENTGSVDNQETTAVLFNAQVDAAFILPILV
jgi:hypothetical protein